MFEKIERNIRAYGMSTISPVEGSLFPSSVLEYDGMLQGKMNDSANKCSF